MKTYQLKDGSVGSSMTPRGWIRVWAEVLGPRERVEFEMTQDDAKQLADWLINLTEQNPPAGAADE